MSELSALAARAGLQSRWHDVRGVEHVVGAASLERLLAALGFPAASAAERVESARRLDERDRRPPALQVVRRGERLLAAAAAAQAFELRDEHGEGCSGRFDDGGAAQPRVAPGYYRLAYGRCEREVAIVPDAMQLATSRPPRGFGLVAQLYALRRHDDGGLGDYEAAARLAAAAGARGADALALSPDHAGRLTSFEHFSPYSPSSRVFRDASYVDPAAVLGTEAFHAAREAIGAGAAWRELERGAAIDWPRAAALRRRVLRALLPACRASEPLWSDFLRWREGAGVALERHARFEALDAHFAGRPWPRDCAAPDAAGVAAFAAEHAEEVTSHAFAQWLAARGIADAQARAVAAGMRIGLLADLAVGVDPHGSDAWCLPDLLLRGATLGAPPDLLAPDGQGWGLTTYSPIALRELGYRPYRDLLRAVWGPVGGVRIDHVIGFERLWLIPDGCASSEGAYVSCPRDDLLGLVALESWRARRVVVGEDLGTVPAGFRAALARHGLLGMSVLPFERDADGFLAAERWRDDAVALTTTHDLPTLVGWRRGRDLQWRRAIGQLDEAAFAARLAQRGGERVELDASLGIEVPPGDDAERIFVDAAIDHVARTPAPLALVPLEDLEGALEQPNLPGTTHEHPNWRRRGETRVEHLFDRPEVAARMARLARRRPRPA